MNNFYLYRHIRLDKNEPFYIGIGTKDKYFSKDSEYYRANCKHVSPIWNKIVDKTPYSVEILLESDNYKFIQEKEIEFIKLYGRKDLKNGTLANLTDGGEGSRGRVVTEQYSRKISEVHRGKVLSEETKNKIRLAHIGKIVSEETRNKARINATGKKMSTSNRLKIDDKIKKPVIQLDKSGKEIQRFSSITDAEKFLGKSSNGTIGLCCKNKRKSALKFKWKFYEKM